MDGKKCFKCGIKKPLRLFYRHPMMGDGHLGKCKSCAKKDVRANRAANLAYYREYDRLRYQPKPRRKGEGRTITLARWRNKNRDKVSAHNKVARAVRAGKLKKLPCVVCGNSRSHGHHDDYTKPLEVRWLCAAHHREVHDKQF